MRLQLIFSAAVAAAALALPNFREIIPNGFNVPGCSHVGHANCMPPARNQFGMDFKAANLKWTTEFCNMDSDGDGVSNGVELGDPCCEWSAANNVTRRSNSISHPGDPSSTYDGPVPTCPGAMPSPSPGEMAPMSPGATAEAPPPASPSAGATPSPSGSVSATAAADDDPVCFPGDARVLLADSRRVRMSALRVGDAVEVGPGAFSPVFMFTHRVACGRFPFVRVLTARGAELHLSPGHFLYVNGALALARDVRPGDAVEVDGAPDAVAAVARVQKDGLYNPQTAHGDIVVDRVRASCYTSAVPHAAAQAALAPLRALFGYFGVATGALEDGVRRGFLPHLEL